MAAGSRGKYEELRVKYYQLETRETGREQENRGKSSAIALLTVVISQNGWESLLEKVETDMGK